LYVDKVRFQRILVDVRSDRSSGLKEPLLPPLTVLSTALHRLSISLSLITTVASIMRASHILQKPHLHRLPIQQLQRSDARRRIMRLKQRRREAEIAVEAVCLNDMCFWSRNSMIMLISIVLVFQIQEFSKAMRCCGGLDPGRKHEAVNGYTGLRIVS
jgi:hypothetical protein